MPRKAGPLNDTPVTSQVNRFRRLLLSNPVALLGDLAFLTVAVWTAWDLPGDITQGRIIDAVVDVAVLAYTGWILRNRLTHRRASIRGERRALLAAVRRIAHDDLWINRDEHVAFTRVRQPLATRLIMFPEDDIHELDAAGAGTFVTTSYLMIRGGADVLRQVEGSLMTTGPDGELAVVVNDRQGWWRRWRDAGATVKAWQAGFAAPDPAELEHVIKLLAGAERFTGDDG